MNKNSTEQIVDLIGEERQHPKMPTINNGPPMTEARAAQIITDFLKSGPAFRKELERETETKRKRRRFVFGAAFVMTAVLLVVFIFIL